jgi:hypothetical protein
MLSSTGCLLGGSSFLQTSQPLYLETSNRRAFLNNLRARHPQNVQTPNVLASHRHGFLAKVQFLIFQNTGKSAAQNRQLRISHRISKHRTESPRPTSIGTATLTHPVTPVPPPLTMPKSFPPLHRPSKPQNIPITP